MTGNLDGKLLLWQKGSEQPSKKVALSDRGLVARSIAVSADGRHIFVAMDDGVVIYDHELNEQKRLTAFDSEPQTIALSRDQKQLLCGMADSTVLAWSLAKLLK